MGAWEVLGAIRGAASGRAGWIFFCLLGYLLLGGLLFQWLEWRPRTVEVLEAVEEVEEERASLLKALWAETITQSEEDWTLAANQRLDLYERELKDLFAKGVDLQDEDDDNPWTLLGSVFYCFTVVTTIGYGNIYPTTTLGRLATVAYGLVGIPLCLIYLTEIGNWTVKKLKQILAKRWPEMDGESGEFDFTLGLGLSLTLLYLFLGGILFDVLEEDWDLIDGLYFSFVSFSTIGFGDLVPERQGWMLLLMLYSFSALSLVASCLTLIQNSLEAQLEARKEQLAAAFNNWRERRATAAYKKTDEEEDEDANTASYSWGQ